jgi:hypothetical protein
LANQAAKELAKGSTQGKSANFTPPQEKEQLKKGTMMKMIIPKKEASDVLPLKDNAPVTRKEFLSMLNEMRRMRGVKSRPDEEDETETETVRIDVGSRARYST